MRRGIKILVPCAWCKRKKYHTSYNETLNAFVCKRCFSLIEANPEIVKKVKGEGRSGLTKIPYEQRESVMKMRLKERREHAGDS